MAFNNALVTLCIILPFVTVQSHTDEEAKPKPKEDSHWGYSGDHGNFDPMHWKDVSKYCDNSKYMQSPINIDTKALRANPRVCDPLHSLDTHFVNDCTGTIDGIAKNNGHSLVVTPIKYFAERHGYIKLNKERNVVMELSNFWNYNYRIRDNNYYCFDSFHFHWGRVNNGKGSEHTIDGEQFPLEAHFVHYSCDYDNIGEALSQWRLGGNIGVGKGKKDIFVLGVIGVIFEIGESNPVLEAVFTNWEKLQKTGSEVLIEGIDLREIMPENKAYYTYEGSLTTPPCFPVVLWHILKEHLTVSLRQMQMLQKLMNSNGEAEGDNYRPLETNPNPVYDCE